LSKAPKDAPEFPEGDIAPGCAHPRAVYDLIGHDAAQAKMCEGLESGRMHHAWLLTGPKGVGKATLAYRLIRRVLGGTPLTPGGLDVPQSDPVAARVESLGHGDFLLLRRPYDLKTKKIRTEIPVSEARKLPDFFSLKASEGGWRVALIDSADDLNVSSENAILKTLEEPPEKTLIILLSSEPGRLLPTIRSRCMNLTLRGVPTGQITDWLTARGVNDKTAAMAASFSRGAPGKAFALAQSEAEVLRPLQSLLGSLPLGNAGLEHRIAGSLAAVNAGEARSLFWDCLTDTVYRQAIYSGTGAWPQKEGPAIGPLKLDRPKAFWLKLWDDLLELQRAEAGLNMDKTTVMLSAMTKLRAA